MSTKLLPQRLIRLVPRRQPSAQLSSTSTSKLSSATAEEGPKVDDENAEKSNSTASNAKVEQTQAELDAELREKLEAMSGGGGISGLELEDGKPVAMKRGTRENMFRLI